MSTGTNTRTRTVQRTTKRNGTTSRRSMARNSSSGASMFQPIPLPHEEASPCRWIAASPEARCFAMARADGSLVVWQAPLAGEPVLGQEYKHMKRHVGSCNCVAWNSDGTKVASAGTDRRVIITDKQLDRASAVVCAGHGRTVWRVVFARDGLLASASGDMSIRLWNSVTGACIMELKSHEAAVQGLAFSLSGALLASSSTDGCIIVWDSKTGSVLSKMSGHHEHVTSLSFHGDMMLASSSSDGTVCLWNPQQGKQLATVQDHDKDVSKVCFHPAGSALVACSHDRSISFIDAAAGATRNRVGGHLAPINDLVMSPDGSVIASADDQGDVIIWDYQSAQMLTRLSSHRAPVVTLSFSTDGTMLLSGDREGLCNAWDLVPAYEGAAPDDKSRCVIS